MTYTNYHSLKKVTMIVIQHFGLSYQQIRKMCNNLKLVVTSHICLQFFISIPAYPLVEVSRDKI